MVVILLLFAADLVHLKPDGLNPLYSLLGSVEEPVPARRRRSWQA